MASRLDDNQQKQDDRIVKASNSEIMQQAEQNLQQDTTEYENTKLSDDQIAKTIKNREDARTANSFTSAFNQDKNINVNTAEGMIKMIILPFKRALEGITSGLNVRWNDDDLKQGKDNSNKKGKDDVEYQEGSVDKKNSNTITEDIGLSNGQGMSKDMTQKALNSEKANTGMSASVASFSVNQNQIDNANKANEPAQGMSFAQYDKPKLGLDENNNVITDPKIEPYREIEGKKIEGSNKYVFEVDDVTARDIFKRNQNGEDTGLKVSKKYDDFIPNNKTNTISSEKKKNEKRKTQAPKVKEKLTHSQGRGRTGR